MGGKKSAKEASAAPGHVYIHHRAWAAQSWTCLDNRSLSCSRTCLHYKGPGNLDTPRRVYTTEAYAAFGRVYTLKGPELHQNEESGQQEP